MARHCLLLLTVALLAGTAAWAEDKDRMQLEQIVVTATRTEVEASQAPASTSVVTQEEIQNRQIVAPDEAVDTLPGVFSTRGKGITDTQASINLRGMPGQERTLVLLDGMPLNSAWDGTVQFGGLNPEDIRRMEVVRGPFSSLYGGYAMGGVVNIITKMPEKEEVKVGLGAGSDGYFRSYASVGNKYDNKLSIFVSTGYQITGGYQNNFVSTYPLGYGGIPAPYGGVSGGHPSQASTGQPTYILGSTGDNRWWDYGITAKVAYDVTPTSQFNFSYYRTAYQYGYGAPNSYLYNSAGARVYGYGSPWVFGGYQGGGIYSGNFGYDYGALATDTYKLGYQGEIGDTKIKTFFGVAKQGTNWFSEPGSGYSMATTWAGGPGFLYQYPNTAYFWDIQATRPIGDRNILTFGADYRYEWIDSTEWNLANWRDAYSKQSIVSQLGGTDAKYAIFAQDEIQIVKPLKAYIGVREDWWHDYAGYLNLTGLPGGTTNLPSHSSSYFSPRGALVYTPFENGNTVLRGSLGQAFRPPTLMDLYGTMAWPGWTMYSNPLLKPETSTSWEIGGEQKLWKGGVFKATYFENYMKDFIDWQTNATFTGGTAVNIGRATIKGYELSLEQKFDKWLRLFMNYTGIDTKVTRDAADPTAVGEHLPYMPSQFFNVGGEVSYRSFSGSLIGRYVGKQFGASDNSDTVTHVYGSYDPYFVADAKLSYQICSFASASLSVRNIFDQTYYSYYLAPGRQWFGTVTLRF